MKQLVWLGLFILLCGGLILYRINKTGYDYTDLTDNGLSATGVVSHIYRGVRYTYSVAEKQHSGTSSASPRNIIDGERFQVFYDPEDPDRSIINFYAPIIDSTEFAPHCADNIRVISGKKKGLISFEYEVNGQLFKRYQKHRHNRELRHSSLEAIVNKTDPRIAYLSLAHCENE